MTARVPDPEAYTPAYLADGVLASRGAVEGERKQVTVLFCDLAGSTVLAERLGPESMHTLLERFFELALAEIHRYGGTVNQFLGDGFMATFGAPISTGNDCQNALAAARELIARVKVKVGIGLHAGDAVTGNVGSAERKQYSVTGNVVILASRIEQLNKEYDSQVLASHEVLERAGEQAAPLGAVRVKGHEQPIEIFRVA